MTTSIRHAGQFVHTGINLGKLQKVSLYTGMLGDSHVSCRYEHGVELMDEAEAIRLQRELLEALATHGYRPDVSGAACDLGGGE